MSKKMIFPKKIRQNNIYGNDENLIFDDFQYRLDGATTYDRTALFKYKDYVSEERRVIENGDYLVVVGRVFAEVEGFDVFDHELTINVKEVFVHDKKSGEKLFDIFGLEFIYYNSNGEFDLYSILDIEIYTDERAIMNPLGIIDSILEEVNKHTKEERIEYNIGVLKNSQYIILDFMFYLAERQNKLYTYYSMLFFVHEKELGYVEKGEVSIRLINYLNSIGEYCVESEHCHELNFPDYDDSIRDVKAKYKMHKFKRGVLEFDRFKVIDVFTNCFHNNAEDNNFTLRRKR